MNGWSGARGGGRREEEEESHPDGGREDGGVEKREREIERGRAVMKEVLIFYRGSLIRRCTDTP